jgi:hypothetical protein
VRSALRCSGFYLCRRGPLPRPTGTTGFTVSNFGCALLLAMKEYECVITWHVAQQQQERDVGPAPHGRAAG